MGDELGELLPNDPGNPCVGCGPRNPLGLQLQFYRVGDSIRTTLQPRLEHQGWPGRLHSAILYLAMLEAANWTLFATEQRIGVARRTGPLTSRRWVGIDERLTIAGRVRSRSSDGVHVLVEAVGRDKDGVAELEREFELPNGPELLKSMGYPAVPPVFEGVPPF